MSQGMAPAASMGRSSGTNPRGETCNTAAKSSGVGVRASVAVAASVTVGEGKSTAVADGTIGEVNPAARSVLSGWD